MIFRTKANSGTNFGVYNDVIVFEHGTEHQDVARVQVNNHTVWLDTNVFEMVITTTNGSINFEGSHGFNLIKNDTLASTFYPAGTGTASVQTGEYTIKTSELMSTFKIKGDLTRAAVNKSWSLTSGSQMFKDATNLTQIVWYSEIDFTDLSEAFMGCTSLVDITLSNTNQITNLASTFRD